MSFPGEEPTNVYRSGSVPRATSQTPYYAPPTAGFQQAGPQMYQQPYATGQFRPAGYPPKKKRSALTIALLCILGVVALVVGVGVIGALAASTAKMPAAATQTTAANTPASCEHGRLADGTCAAEEQPAAAPTEPSTFKLPVGQALTETSDDGVASITVTKIAKSKSGCRGSQLKSQKGIYVIVDVKVEITSGTASVNPLYWEFVGSDGTTEDSIGGIFAGCQALGSGNGIPVGVRKGQVVFDVADPAGEITYNEPAHGPVASWLIP